MTDKELLANIKAGKKEYYEVLYERYADKIYRKCIGMTHDPDAAEDLVHDIFIKIITKIDTFKGLSKFSLWVHSITYNHCINFLLKRNKVRRQNNSNIEPEDIPILNIEAEHEELKNLRVEQLRQFMEQLKPIEKAILLARYQDEMSVKQIALTFKMNDSAVKMRLKRGRDKLAELFKKVD